MRLRIGSLKYEQGDLISPGRVMRDRNLEDLNEAYHLLEKIRKLGNIEVVYVYPCDICQQEKIYETINKIPDRCDCNKEINPLFDIFVDYIVL